LLPQQCRSKIVGEDGRAVEYWMSGGKMASKISVAVSEVIASLYPSTDRPVTATSGGGVNIGVRLPQDLPVDLSFDVCRADYAPDFHLYCSCRFRSTLLRPTFTYPFGLILLRPNILPLTSMRWDYTRMAFILTYTGTTPAILRSELQPSPRSWHRSAST
jgi:hypothetical protein